MPTHWYNTDFSPLCFIAGCLLLAPSVWWIMSEWAKDGRK